MGGDHLWDAIGAIGEILGALAVVATLVYLTIQVRQNTTSVRVSSYQSVTSQFAELNRSVLESENVADIVFRGDRSPDELEELDYRRYSSYQSAWFRHYENLHFQYKLKMLPHSQWRSFRVLLGNRMLRPGVSAWWDASKAAYDKDFQVTVEDIRERAKASGEEARN